MNKIENINLLPDTEPDSGDYTGDVYKRQALACGAWLICWRATARITRAPMLMYGKEASNRKQEIDRQH